MRVKGWKEGLDASLFNDDGSTVNFVRDKYAVRAGFKSRFNGI